MYAMKKNFITLNEAETTSYSAAVFKHFSIVPKSYMTSRINIVSLMHGYYV